MTIQQIKCIALTLVLAAGLIACEKKGPAEVAGEKIDNAAEAVKDKAHDAAESVKDMVDQNR